MTFVLANQERLEQYAPPTSIKIRVTKESVITNSKAARDPDILVGKSGFVDP